MFVYFPGYSKLQWLPWPIRQKSGTLYSGDHNMTLLSFCLSCLVVFFFDFSVCVRFCHRIESDLVLFKVCRQRRKTFLLLYCLFFFIFLFFFFSTNCVLRFLCHFNQIFLYTFWRTKIKGQSDKVTLNENAYSAWCKFQGRRLKVKVTRRQPLKNVVRLYLSYVWTSFCETWLVNRQYHVH